jgi:spore maturation protein CgeB
MSHGVRVLVAASFPDRMNTNVAIRRFLFEGLREAMGERSVAETPVEVLAGAVRRLRPALTLCVGSCPPEAVNYHPVRAACDEVGCHLAFWLHDDPYEFDFEYSAVEVADTLFSNDRWSVEHYEHPRVFHLPMAGSAAAHCRPWVGEKARDVFFCGVAFENRVSIVRDLSPVLSRCRTEIIGPGWPGDMRFGRGGRLSNAELADACARSWVTLNLGRTLNLANRRYQLDPSTPGPRTFEAALAGTVQMYFVDSLEITDYFEPDTEILLFDGPEDFAAQLHGLLADPERAKRIAESARRRALREHTYAARARRILEVCGLSAEPMSSQSA